ncbi:hypothetical protein [Hoeflea poritis]|uniref:Uncharacterized protein n=1 Tax=Hoeflea poritis TaxID=2993659 RepID=A0ABT4VMM7_9HYPH|nr:hypothetical protein [Hoeflea poritis]MDA4845921.1 hypothetical protein [Hoeflea poritis]
MTEKPKIELKAVELIVRASEETPCYAAKVYVDGKHFANVENSGHGGGDNVHPPKSGEWAEFHQKLQDLEARIAETYPPHSFEAGDETLRLEESLEGLCHALVWEWHFRRLLKRKLKSKVLVFRAKDNRVVESVHRLSPTVLEGFRKRYGNEEGHVILNDQPFDKALKLYTGEAA